MTERQLASSGIRCQEEKPSTGEATQRLAGRPPSGNGTLPHRAAAGAGFPVTRHQGRPRLPFLSAHTGHKHADASPPPPSTAAWGPHHQGVSQSPGHKGRPAKTKRFPVQAHILLVAPQSTRKAAGGPAVTCCLDRVPTVGQKRGAPFTRKTGPAPTHSGQGNSDAQLFPSQAQGTHAPWCPRCPKPMPPTTTGASRPTCW